MKSPEDNPGVLKKWHFDSVRLSKILDFKAGAFKMYIRPKFALSSVFTNAASGGSRRRKESTDSASVVDQRACLTSGAGQ